MLFLTLGVWAGRRLVARRASLSAPVLPDALSDAELDRLLEKHRITRREYEVLQLIAQGMGNQEIAARMFVSLNTVKTHTSNLFSKLDVRRRIRLFGRSPGNTEPQRQPVCHTETGKTLISLTRTR